MLTSTIDEAYTQQLALHRSLEKYLLIDTSKIGKEDFTQLCHLEDLTAVVVDKMMKIMYKIKSLHRSDTLIE